MTSVLVVDDSRFVRKLVGSKLTDHGYEVGTASDGHEAVQRVQMCDPDVVTMDVRMPGMDGIEAVEEIMARSPTPVVMLSAHTAKGAEATIRALARGAVDFLHKPGGEDDVDIDDLESNLIQTIEAVEGAPTEALVPTANAGTVDESSDAGADADAPEAADQSEGDSADTTADADAGTDTAGGSTAPGTDSPGGAPRPDDAGRPDGHESILEDTPNGMEVDLPAVTPDVGGTPTVVIGASTGGPNVVEAVLRRLPASLDARVLVVQHMPPSFTDRLASHLDEASDYDIREAEDGSTVGPGEGLVAKGDHHMRVTDKDDDRLTVSLSRDRRVHSVRPSVDVTMGSVVQVDPGPLVGVVLTGMGKDGAVGIEAIKSVGGTTIVQNEDTCPVYSMPRNAIETGCVDRVLPPDDIPDAICDAVREREREEAHA